MRPEKAQKTTKSGIKMHVFSSFSQNFLQRYKKSINFANFLVKKLQKYDI
jgi:hypothetical protein